MFDVASRARTRVLMGAALVVMLSPMGARAGAQQANGGTPDVSLAGVFDTHAHVDPDSAEPSQRGVDVIDLARQAKARGMRGFVIKQHFDESAPMAALVRKE